VIVMIYERESGAGISGVTSKVHRVTEGSSPAITIATRRSGSCGVVQLCFARRAAGQHARRDLSRSSGGELLSILVPKRLHHFSIITVFQLFVSYQSKFNPFHRA
jgi:hypothetical protein